MEAPSSAWTNRFRSLDERLLLRIAALLPGCLSDLGAASSEDEITVNLISRLLSDPETRRMVHYIEFQFHVTELVGSVEKVLGIIDVAVFRDQDRRSYLAFECKRLNVFWKGKRHSLSGAYVKDGLIRFVTEQYCKNLPVGWMLGYVMDRDLPYALARVESAIKKHSGFVGLLGGPTPCAPVASCARFETMHLTTSGQRVLVRHALL